LSWRPAFADHKLNFAVNVFNVFNERKERQSEYVYEDSPYSVANNYGMGNYFEAPRFVRLSASYDF
jgi:outer membrane receptor protein involved in Fe transport